MRKEAELEVVQPSGHHTLKKEKRNRKGKFHNTSSVTSMLDHLEWNFLETRRNIAKVTMLYKSTHNLVAINPDFYLSSQTSLLNYTFRLEKILCTFYIIQCSVNCDDYAPSIVTTMHRREQTIYLQLINKKRKK
jgi:hypothetical protein